MSFERKSIVITTDEYYFIQQCRKLEDDQRNRVMGYAKALMDNPFLAAVRENRKMHPERFFADATISDYMQEVNA